VKIVEPNDLVAMKLRAGRPQDDYDISELIRSGMAEVAIVKSRVTSEQFERFVTLQQRTK